MELKEMKNNRRLSLGIVNYIKSLDLLLILIVMILSFISVMMIKSATNGNQYVIKQLVGIGIGIVLMFIVSVFDYEILCDFWLPIAVASSVLLIITAIFAEDINGNRNWINLGFFNLQSSEFTKIAFAISMSAHLQKVSSTINKPKTMLFVFLHFFLYIIPVILQKDIGSALIYLAAFCIILYIAGIQYRYIFLSVLLGVAATPLVWTYLSDYQKARIIYGLQPELDPTHYGYQPLIARLAIGSGQLTGMGYENGIQIQNGQLPADHTDFIFAVVGEEFGFVGCLILILLLILVVVLIIRNAFKAQTKSGAYICIILASVISVQAVVNIGMCLGISPVIGVTLPFMSYGGSSILSLLIGIGLIQSVRRKPDKKLSFKILK